MKTYPESRLTDLLIEFDEMGFAPITVCENPEQYAIDWREMVRKEFTRLTAENDNLTVELEVAQRDVENLTRTLEEATDEIKALEAENAELRARLDKAAELPCKVGDTIYQTDTNGTRIFKNTVKNIIFETDGVAFDERAIGESIFLTEEAVKEKMKKLQEKRQ